MSSVAANTTNGTQSAGPVPLPDPLDPNAQPPLDRYCDLVLKGGVVDGVIYPGVLLELARGFRFQSLAGTSVGAIAAALAAACEYARRFGSDAGFNDVLRTLPRELGEKPTFGPHATVLRALFQTVPSLQRPFDLAVAVASVRMGEFWSTLLAELARRYRNELVSGFLAAAAVLLICNPTTWRVGAEVLNSLQTGCGLSHPSQSIIFDWLWNLGFAILTCLAGGVFAAVAMVCFALYKEYQSLAAQPGFGFCSGLSTNAGQSDGLTEWLHRGIQGAAGLPLSRPLTFKDLWRAPGGPAGTARHPVAKSIDLRMMTTCVSHGRPYELPLEDRSVRLFFRPDQWSKYFPPSVIAHLVRTSQPYTEARRDVARGAGTGNQRQPDQYNSPDPQDQPCPCRLPDGTLGKCTGKPGCKTLFELPLGEMPVLVGVRLSMNFPILFQAVPVWAIDHEGGRIRQHEDKLPAFQFKEAWFADGGVTSNFPLHIFDSPLPAWPTFGIYIAERARRRNEKGDLELGKDGQKMKYDVTTFHTTGRSEKWDDFDDAGSDGKAKPSAASRFSRYLTGLVVTAKDWADNANLRMPGVRDRVAIVYKNDQTNGGLNLNLDGQKIWNLAYDNGTGAGRKLARKFLPGEVTDNPALEGSAAWCDHRWVRFNAYLAAIKTHISGFTQAANHAPGTSPLGVQIAQARRQPPLYWRRLFEPTLNEAQARALAQALEALENLERQLEAIQIEQPYVAQPQHELKARSRL